MKRFLAFLFIVTMTVLFCVGCNDDDAQPPADDYSEAEYDEDTESIDDGLDNEAGSVAMFDGIWWYRETPADGASLDIFCFEGDTVVFYDLNGNELTRGEVTDYGDGTFSMALELFGDVECRFGQADGSWTITTTEDGSLFLSGDPIYSSAVAGDYTGKWYQSGDLDEDYLAINEDGSYGIYTVIGNETLAREEGKWELMDRENGKTLAVDGSFSRSSFYIAADGTAIWDSDDRYYIKESLIGSIEGDLARQIVSLYAAEYWAPEVKEVGAIYLEFHEDGTLTVMTRKEDGAIEDRGDGSWEQQTKGTYELTLDDGQEYTFTVNEGVLTLDDGSVFNRLSYFG
jgi:hypothetical protein